MAGIYNQMTIKLGNLFMNDCQQPSSITEQANYIAISILEKLGLGTLTQKQIDLMGSIVMLALEQKIMTLKELQTFVDTDNIARRILFRHLGNLRD